MGPPTRGPAGPSGPGSPPGSLPGPADFARPRPADFARPLVQIFGNITGGLHIYVEPGNVFNLPDANIFKDAFRDCSNRGR